MTLKVSFEISDRDLRRFRSEMRRARQSVKDADEQDIVAAAKASLEEVGSREVPEFVKQRIPQLGALLDMLQDEQWDLDAGARAKILGALIYFSDPEDLIPDGIPGLGLLDDAIVIELVLEELKHDIEAYRDFLNFRATYYKRHKVGRDAASRDAKIDKRLRDLKSRAARRKQRDKKNARLRLL